MDQIIEYIKQRYSPVSIIVYGSYADGTNDASSDFDALVISDKHSQFHDTSFVNGIQLDVFVYPKVYFSSAFDPADFIRITDGKIVLDTCGDATKLKESVLEYQNNKKNVSKEEIRANIDWCSKMLVRAKRGDVEGMFRWHWVLIDSLEIFCDAVHHTYLGPKKTLKWMETNQPTAFDLYRKALFHFDEEHLSNWITYLKGLL